MIKKIVIKGAKEHNLKNISLEIPKDKFVVITGIVLLVVNFFMSPPNLTISLTNFDEII